MASTADAGLSGIPSPPATSVAASSSASPLPHPRRRPLQPGGPKESELIRYLDRGLNDVQKRADNRLQKSDGSVPGALGYRHFGQVEKDVEALVDVIWVSGSRTYHLATLRSHHHEIICC